MPSKPPKPQQAPFQQQQSQQTQGTTTNTYGTQSVANTPEGQAFSNIDLDFGSPMDVDPGVGRRTALAEERAGYESDNAFNAGIPREYRQMLRDSTVRDIRGRGAAESQQAQFLNQQGNNAMRGQRTNAALARGERLLPQIVGLGSTSTGNMTGSSSGFNTQFPQSQPGFWQRAALGLIQNAGQAATSRFGGG